MKKFLLLAACALMTAPAFAQFTSGGAEQTTTGNSLAEQVARNRKGNGLTTAMVGDNSSSSTGKAADDSYGRFNFGYSLWTASPSGGEGTGYNGFFIDWVIAGVNISNGTPLFAEFGVKMDYNFWKEDTGSDKYKNSASYMAVSIPVNLTYRLPLGDGGVKLSPFAGINLKFNVTGESKREYPEEHTSTIGTGRYQSTYTSTIQKKVTTNWFDSEDMNDHPYKRFQLGWQIGANLDIKKFTIGLSYGTDFIKIAEKVNTSTFNVGIGFNY